MTETPTPSQPEDSPAPAPCKASRRPLVLALLTILIACGAVALTVSPSLLPSGEPAPRRVTAAAPEPSASSLTALELKLKEIDERLAKLESKPAASGEKNAGPDGEDLERLKLSLAGLSNALTLVQAQMEKSSQETHEVREKTQAGLATSLAFMQMQNAALSGATFEKERQTLRTLAGDDQLLIEKLLRLEPFALQGTASPEALRREWQELSGPAQTALRKATATTWQERILVALESLVSIRSLKPEAGQTLSFTAIEGDLAHGNVQAALEKVAALPTEAQEALQPWRQEAERRKAMENALADLAAYLISRGEPPAAASEPAPQQDPSQSEAAP